MINLLLLVTYTFFNYLGNNYIAVLKKLNERIFYLSLYFDTFMVVALDLDL